LAHRKGIKIFDTDIDTETEAETEAETETEGFPEH
jgi:hypothetical protein